MKGDARKSTSKAREIRKLAARIPDQRTFERIIADVGADQHSAAARQHMKEAVRAQLIPYLTFQLKEEATCR